MVKLRDVGEKEAIKLIGKVLFKRDLKYNVLSFNDDAIALKINNLYVVFNIDGFTLKYSKYYWLSYYDLGWKASTSAISDIVVKDVRPEAIVASLGLRKNRSLKTLKEMIRGMRDSAYHHNVKYLGGDLNEAGEEWVSVACIGFSGKKPVPRKASLSEKDLVVSYGKYGLTGVALHAHYNKVNIYSWRKVVKLTRKPKIPMETLNFIHNLGRECVLASIDSSDGLAESLIELMEINNVGFIIENIPIDSEALEYARTYDLDPLELALYGGEEFYPILVIKKTCVSKLKEVLKNYPEFKVIGKVLLEKGVYIRRNGRVVEITRRGWEYFKNK